MGKIVALDIGDQWTGVALSDALQLFAKPFVTWESSKLIHELSNLLKSEKIALVVIGFPKTMRGTESLQTKKIINMKEQLEKKIPGTSFMLWDERLSSKRAESVSQAKTKEQKLKSHAIAAAFILDSYLQFLSSQKSLE